MGQHEEQKRGIRLLMSLQSIGIPTNAATSGVELEESSGSPCRIALKVSKSCGKSGWTDNKPKRVDWRLNASEYDVL